MLVATLPAASCAVTVTAVEPGSRTNPVIVQLAVPAAVPLLPRSVDHVTCVTPTLSDAVPLRLSGLAEAVNVGLEVGEVMLIVGATVSAGV
jgi:hypothetical protein